MSRGVDFCGENLVVAGEVVFGLPFHTARFFRPTMLEVFGFTNTQLGDLFALYGVTAMLSYFPGGAIADHFSARGLLSASLVATAIGGLFMATKSFHAGALNINMSKFDAARAVELIESHRVTVMFDFAPILGSVLDEQEKSGRDIGSLKFVLGLEAPDTIERYQSHTGGTFFVMYGQTETSAIATYGKYDDRPGSAGKTIPLCDVKLVNDADETVATGAVGEIAVKGPMVFKEYWNLPEDTAHAFRGGWHHTGDMGRFDEDGFLWYAGRKAEKELIKPGGENVYPAEVEKVIMEHPAIEKTVVFGVPDPKWKEGIKTVCQLKEGQSLEPKELIEFVGSRIARYKKPQYVEFVGELPRLDDGSPDRSAVKERFGGLQQ